jgi:hypothetical protein
MTAGRNTPSHRRRRDVSGKSTLKILITHEFVMGWWVMFGKIIGAVGFAGTPVEIEVLLGNAIF